MYRVPGVSSLPHLNKLLGKQRWEVYVQKS